MKITILTLFPEMFDTFKTTSIIKRAINNNQVEINIVNIRDYTNDPHKKVDDKPYGNQYGMIMTLQPVVDAIRANKTNDSHIILTSAKGKTLKQAHIRNLANNHKDIIIICGHYEGIDDRIEHYIDEQISIGDFIITGGELSSMIISDAIIRVLDGVITSETHMDESYENGLLEYPQYTKPRDFEGHLIPDIIVSGHHENIRKYNLKESLRLTLLNRPDLITNKELNKEEKILLDEIYEEINE